MSIDREFEKRVCRIAEQALEIPEAERKAFLDRACAGQEELRREVEKSFEYMESGDDSLLSPGLRELVSRIQSSAAGEADPHEEERISRVPYEELADHLTTPSEGFGSRYRLRGEVDHGGMGVVLRVWDENLHRPLAMKVILGEGKGRKTGETPPIDSRVRRRFLEEAHVTGRLDHPGVVPVHELGLDDHGRIYFTMKLVKGRTLEEVIGQVERGEEGWTRTRALGLLLRVCEAVAYAHDKGVVHRDLKPRNVMVGRFGEVYVMDWGLAQILGDEERSESPGAGEESRPSADGATRRGEDSPQLTHEGDVLGTPAYMPIEQARGERAAIGPHSDVYSVGAMLYHLLVGRAPYVRAGEKPSSRVVLARVLEGSPPALEELVSDVPAELSAICEKAMARNAKERYSTMQGLGDDLRAYIEGRVVRAHETGAWPEAKKWVKRNRALAGSLGAVIALLIVGTTTAWILTEWARMARAAELQAVEEVTRLKISQDYEGLIAEAEKLWPAVPGIIEDYEDWIADAGELVEQIDSLRETRQRLREVAFPPSETARGAESERNPEDDRFQLLVDELESKRSALAVRRGEVSLTSPSVDWSRLPERAKDLDQLAWPRVSPRRTTFGEELLGLTLAEKALRLAPPEQKGRIAETVAWGRFALGLDEAALAAGATAFDGATGANTARERDRIVDSMASLEAGVEFARSATGLARAEEELARLQERHDFLVARMNDREELGFPDEELLSHWWHNQLTKLIVELEALREPERGLLTERGVSTEHGWSIPRRLTLAERLRDGFAPGAAFAARWEEALPGIHDRYPGLELSLQMGLVPIGTDPNSGLWEFWHVASGAEPLRLEDGRLSMREDSGLVLVLLPGGRFWMGAQATDPTSRNYDPGAVEGEWPVHEVVLSAFFLSKYEMTQGQWLRLSGSRPSYWNPSWRFLEYEHDLTHPVEQISWLDCMDLLPDFGLSVPSEAQWEYAARAGTSTPWWTGAERESLRGSNAVNLADQAAGRERAPWSEIDDWPELDDRYAAHAPIGFSAANPFGLHEIHGNVFEWCLDGIDRIFYSRSPASDPVSPVAGFAAHVCRGGCFYYPSAYARVAYRDSNPSGATDDGLGVRPARAVE